MSENNDNDNEGRCARTCSICSCGCLDLINRIGSRFRNFPYRQCFKALPKILDKHFVASLVLFLSAVLSITSWFEFKLMTSISVSAYCVALVFCAALTFIVERGRCCAESRMDFRLVEEDLANPPCISPEVDLVERDPADSAEPGPADSVHVMERISVTPPPPEPVIAKVEVHKPAQSSESSISNEPEPEPEPEVAAPKDEPAQQVVVPSVVKTLPQSSTETSLSTTSTPLD